MIYEKIEKALNSAIALHNEGMSANDSIVKVARDRELNPETISRVVEAFNIAKTKAYVKLASDKAADFDLATKKDVIKAVFSDEPESKVASYHSGDSDDFSLKVLNHSIEEKFVARSISERPIEYRIKEAFQAIESQDRDLSLKRESVIEARENFTSALKEATDLLQYSDEKEKIATYASQIFSEYSDNPRAGKILGLVAKCNGIEMSSMVDKLSSYEEYVPSPLIESFERMVDADARYAIAANSFNEDLSDSISKQAEMRGLVDKIANVNREECATDLLVGGARRKVKIHKFAEFPSDLIQDISHDLFYEKVAADDKGKSKGPSMNFKGMLDVLDKPVSSIGGISGLIGSQSSDELAARGHDLKLRGNSYPKVKAQAEGDIDNIKRESILRELMHDEIISQQDPSEVANAYNTMSELAPRASMIKDVVRSVLRQGTAQTIDPHFANTLVDLENNLIKRDTPLAR